MDEKSVIDWKKDSQSFDAVAGLYEEYRPDYPEELVESIIALSGLPKGGRILEVGSGTGKATRLFVRRGYSVHCIEPGANLAALAAHNLQEYPHLTFENARFEQAQDFSAEFDLVISAQAFHWVSKEVGYTKAARALKPGGALALFWNMSPGFDERIARDLDRIYREVAPELDSRSQNPIEEVINERSEDIIGSGCFSAPAIRRFPWSKMYPSREYIGLLNTYSDHLRLTASTRQRLFERIAAVIDAQDGSIEKKYIAVLYVAKKLA